MIFKRHDPNQIAASELEAIQYASVNPSHEAVLATEDKRRHFLLNPDIHPWSVEDRVQAQMATYAIAYANDRMAEAMMFTSVKTDKKGHNILHKQVNQFSLELSRLALDRLQYAYELEQFDGEVEFSEEQRAGLYIANLLPTFPEFPYGYERDTPYDRAIENGVVVPEFVEGMNRAAANIQTDTCQLIETLERYPIQPPYLYASLLEVVKNNYIYNASEQNEYSAQLLGSNTLTAETLSDAYEKSYTGYVSGVLGFTALHAPAILGPDWVLDRSQH